MGGNIEVVPAGVDAKVHGSTGGSADEAGDTLFVAFIEPLRQGQKEGHHADFLHLEVRQDTDVGV